ncbi:hypothetical protein COU74_00680 [Candidatus Peregrinibacteria bacterium CG10_big_fil_rev_8_21_14_0_10_36_19]|nr:MAG: hypothetical protein COU74_00680 [Candidatus Peregrinibacteria bacterium CG10_big_fil_rev_8_21_14_0_10_36_19]
MNFKKALFAAVVLCLVLFGLYFYFSEGGENASDSGKASVLDFGKKGLVEIFGDLMIGGSGSFDINLKGEGDRVWLQKRVNFANVLGYWEGPYKGFKGLEAFEGEQAAFVVSDVGQKYPGAVFYLDVSSDLGAGKDLSEFLGDFVKDFLVSFGFNEDSLNEKVVIVRGFGMKKMTIDWSKVGEASLVLGASELSDLIGENLQFYYGISDDGVLILAIYPHFEDVYGEGKGVNVGSEVFVLVKGMELYANLNGLDGWKLLGDYLNSVLDKLKDKKVVELEGDYDESSGMFRGAVKDGLLDL